MNEQRFFDLAMKMIAGQATETERAELDVLLAAQPELKAEFDRLEAEVRLAREALPLVAATESSQGEFPAYARGRLQTKVNEVLRSRGTTEKQVAWRWRWGGALALVMATVVLLIRPAWFDSSDALVIQVAMLDRTGVTRGGTSEAGVEIQRVWEGATLISLPDDSALEVWQKDWPKKSNRPLVKIVYDQPAAEVRVLGRWKGRMFQEIFTVEEDLLSVFEQVNAFIMKETAR